MLRLILKPLTLLPLPILHHLGSALGHLLFYSARKAKVHAIENMTQSGLFSTPITTALRESFIATGKGVLETLYLWNSSNQTVEKLMQRVNGWDIVEEGINSKKGIIFIVPHMGCFEMASLYYSLHQPITVMYRPPKKAWLRPLVNMGRKRDNNILAEANASGVRKLFKTLKNGGAVGILPDQTPSAGEGEWADFFDKPAYTMTLASKLAKKTGATIIMTFAERLPNGKGYELHFSKVDSIATTTLLNQAIEKQIKQAPNQYYWSYHRYKVSRKAQAKPHNKNTLE